MRNRSPNVRQSIRRLVWNTHVGSERGTTPCHCCGTTIISPFNFECGHIVARAKGGQDSVDNLRPICGLCNRSMATMNMYEFMRLHKLPLTKFAPCPAPCLSLTLIIMFTIFYIWYHKIISF